MVQNAAVQALRQAEDVKQKLLEENDEVIVTTKKRLLLTQLQNAYREVLLVDLDYALDKKVEQDLWNIGFKNLIESLQNSTKDKKNPRRAESQMLLNWCIQAATGFYISLLHQICSSFKLNLPFRCNIPVLADCPQNSIITPRPPRAASCWYICQYCLVHLGDLARYTRQLKAASTFYRQALSVSPSNGQPYNQLGLLRATRGDKLGAVYYHARGLAVGGPFLPAHNNLARTLAQANSVSESTPSSEEDPFSLSDGSMSFTRLNHNLFLMQYMSIHHHILTNGDMDKAQKLTKGMTSTLTALVATQQFQQDVIMQICCLSMYSIFSLTEGHTIPLEGSSLADEEQRWLSLAIDVMAGTMEALLLPLHTTPQSEHVTYVGLPPIKILMEWLRLHSEMLGHSAFVSRPQLWPGLCVLLTGLQKCINDFNGDMYDTIPLPEDEELRGFLPVDKAFSKFKFSDTVSSEMYGDSIIEMKKGLPDDPEETMSEKEIIGLKKQTGFSVSEGETLKRDNNFVDSLRGYRLIQMGKWLADFFKEKGTENISMKIEDGTLLFTSIENAVESNPELVKAIKELSILKEKKLSESQDLDQQEAEESDGESKTSAGIKSNDNSSTSLLSASNMISGGAAVVTSSNVSPSQEGELMQPIIISEADFREKVREKKAGILKPQGSLERARIEKAALTRFTVRDSPAEMIDAQDNQDTGSSCSTVSQDGNICSDVGSLLEPSIPKEKGKKTRTNVALQAILRKQEESNKQVKFLTPVTTPDSVSEPTPQLSPQLREPEKKILQPKVIKSLASLPTDRKTGGILSLKDRSGVYPHLQNVEASGETKGDPAEATDEDAGNLNLDTSTEKNTISPSKHSGKSASSSDKSYPSRYSSRLEDKTASEKLQAQSNFSFFSSPGITLPVVNPKEIDVRSAAMHKPRTSYGVGEPYIPADNFNPDVSMPYSYWGNVANPNIRQPNPGTSKNFHNLPPRLANVKRSPNEHHDMQYGPQDQSSFSVFTPQAVRHTWWKPQEQNYDRNFPTHSMTSPNYQQQPPMNYQQPPQPNFIQSPSTSSQYQQNMAYYQSPMPNQTDFSRPTYNSPMYSESPFGSNMGYSGNMYASPSTPSTFTQNMSYNPAMYPQFTNRFGVQSQTQAKPPEYNINPYSFENQQTHPYGVGQDRPGLKQTMPGMSPNLKQAAYQPGPPGQQHRGQFVDNSRQSTTKTISSDAKGKIEDGTKPPADSASLSMYSLFNSGAGNVENVWPAAPPTQQNVQQSLWSGSGPSPLERLLEQQKQFKYPPDE